MVRGHRGGGCAHPPPCSLSNNQPLPRPWMKKGCGVVGRLGIPRSQGSSEGCSKPASDGNPGRLCRDFAYDPCIGLYPPILTMLLSHCAVKPSDMMILGDRTGPCGRTIRIAIFQGLGCVPLVWNVSGRWRSPSRGKSLHEAKRKACSDGAQVFHGHFFSSLWYPDAQ